MRAWLFALTLAAPSLTLGCGASASEAARAPVAGAVLPDVPVVDLDRAPRSIETLRGGRPALLTFWATWCDSCERELPALNRLNDRVTGEHAVVIGVAVGEAPSKVRTFVEKHGLRYAMVVDEDLRLADALGQRRLPATVVLDRSGRVVYAGGVLDAAALDALRRAMAP